MGLDRGHGQPLSVADLLVAQAQGDERQDFALALGQARDLLGGLGGPECLDGVLGGVAPGPLPGPYTTDVAGARGGEQPACGPRGDDGAAVVDGTDRGGELLGRGACEQEAGGTGLDGVHDGAVGVGGGQDDDSAGRAAGHELAGGGRAAQARHLHVEEEDIGRVGGVARERFLAVGGPPDDLQVRLRPQQRGQAHDVQRLVVSQTQADHRRLPFLTATHRKYPPFRFGRRGFVLMKCRRRPARFAISE